MIFIEVKFSIWDTSIRVAKSVAVVIDKEFGLIRQITTFTKLSIYAKFYLDENHQYPILRFDPSIYTENDRVKANLLESTNFPATLKNFDWFEDYPKFYNRIIIDTFNAQNVKESAILYTKNTEETKIDYSKLDVIESGDYFEYLERTKK